jgi:hypothetical protein
VTGVSSSKSVMLADEALDRLRRIHSGEMYDCVACYRHELCAEREMIRQYDILLADKGKRLSFAETLLEENDRLRERVDQLRYAVEVCKALFEARVKSDVVLAADMSTLSICEHALATASTAPDNAPPTSA